MISLAVPLAPVRDKIGVPVTEEVTAQPTTVFEPAVKVPTCKRCMVVVETAAAGVCATPVCKTVPAALVFLMLKVVKPPKAEVMPTCGS